MPKFRLVAKDPSGKQISRTVEAGSKEEVASGLRREKMEILSIVEEGGAPGTKEAPKKSIFDIQIGSGAPKIGGEGLAIFTRQFSTMIGAGIPVLECLDVLEEQAEDRGFKKALGQVIEDVRGGTDLSAALSKHPRCFDRIYVSMIKAGEASGQLDGILKELAAYIEGVEQLKREIRGAMTYPVVSLVMIFGITIFLLVFIIPRFNEIFKAMGITLPLPTRIVLGISRAMTDFGPHLTMLIVGSLMLLFWWKSTDSGGYLWDKLMLRLPIFGDLFRKIALSRFSKTFATLLRSGVAILNALEIVAATSGNRVVERAVNAARESIRQGEPLAKPLAAEPVFPPMVVRMIAIGERSGALEQLLEKISEFYDQQVEATVESLTSLIEPVMIGIMGLIVGGIVLAVFLPILKIQEALRQKKH